MIWLISSIAPLFSCNYSLADVFDCATVLLPYCTTVLLQLWIGSVLLWHDCFITIIIQLISPTAPLFYWNCDLVDFFYCHTGFLQLGFGWFLLLHHCFIAIMSPLISSIEPLFYCDYDLSGFFCCKTILLQL